MAAAGVRINPIGIAVIGAVVLLGSVYAFGLPSIFIFEAKVNMKELLSVSIELAKRGGEKVKEVRAKHTPGDMGEKVKGKTEEGAKEMMTDADLESHRAIVYGFQKAFPDLKVVSEEHETKPVDMTGIQEPSKNSKEVEDIQSGKSIPYSDITVWIDPLDATQEFTEDLQQYVTTLVCVAVRGQPTIGVIHHVFSGVTEWGYVGYGHSKNLDKKDDVEEDKEKKDPYTIIVSRSHAGQVSPVVKQALGEDTVIVPAGGAGYKTSKVISGEADAYVHVTFIKKWDICAGNAIIMEKGGRMTTVEGRGIDYSYGDPGNQDGLIATLKDHDKYVQALKPSYNILREELDKAHRAEKAKKKEV